MSQEDSTTVTNDDMPASQAEPAIRRDRRSEAARTWQQMQYRAAPADLASEDDLVEPQD